MRLPAPVGAAYPNANENSDLGYLENGTAVVAIGAGKWAKRSHEILARQLAANLTLLEEPRKTNGWLAHIAELLRQSDLIHGNAPAHAGESARP